MKLFGFILTCLILGVLIYGAIEFKEAPRYNIWKEKATNVKDYLESLVKNFKHNLSFDFSPQRKRPLSFSEQESRLADFLPQVFGGFSLAQWEEFWNYIYQPLEVTEGKLKTKRYRTQEEIQDQLKELYPNPFSYFQAQHWSYFWEIVYKKI